MGRFFYCSSVCVANREINQGGNFSDAPSWLVNIRFFVTKIRFTLFVYL